MKQNAQLVSGKMIDDKDLCIFKISVIDFLQNEGLEKIYSYIKNEKTDDDRKAVLLSDVKDKDVRIHIENINKFVENICKTQYAQLVESEFNLTTWIREPELIKWNDQSYLPAHIDGNERIAKPSITIGALIYLNDEYDGGELYFPEYNIQIKPKTGDLVIFPCHFLHEVKKISNGERYTLPLFYSFRCTEWMGL